VYTIAAGTTGIVPFPVLDEYGNKHYEQAQFDIDEETLKKISQITGAEYFRATDTESLRNIYAQIDKLEKISDDLVRNQDVVINNSEEIEKTT
jgi:Ca-activated chloride channel family protein